VNARFPTPYEAVGARLRPVALPPGGPDGAQPLFDLRVLNGAQKDAVVSFGAGRLLIGNDLECDIVLHRPGEALRAMLSVIDGRLSVAAISGPLQLNQVTIAPGESQTAVHGDTVRLADIGLQLSRHEPPEAPPAPEPAVVEEDSSTALPEPEAATGTDNGVAQEARVDPPPPRPRLWPAAACLALACACAGAWFWQAAGGSATRRPAPAVADGGGPAAAATGKARTLSDARELLDARRIQAGIGLSGPGALLLTVAPERLAQAREALAALLADVDGIRRVDVRVEGSRDRLPAMSAVHGPDGIVVTDNLMLDADAVFNGKNRIVMVSLEPMPSILTQGGRRLFQGAQLDARTTVEQIAPSVVTVTIDGVKRRVKL